MKGWVESKSIEDEAQTVFLEETLRMIKKASYIAENIVSEKERNRISSQRELVQYIHHFGLNIR